MKGVISFCLFGSDPLYVEGLKRNYELAAKLYPGWEVHAFLGAGVPSMTAQMPFTDCANQNPMLSRFLVAESKDHTHFLIRDCDSRLSVRERLAVDEWLASDLPFHMIADHPHHTLPLHGGLWGGRTGLLPISQLLERWTGPKQPGPRDLIYNNDQLFLNQCVWPLVRGRILRHDSCTRRLYPWATPFPSTGNRFVGERFTATDEPFARDWEIRASHLNYE